MNFRSPSDLLKSAGASSRSRTVAIVMHLSKAMLFRRLVLVLGLSLILLGAVELLLRMRESGLPRTASGYTDLAQLARQIGETDLQGRERDARFMKLNFAAFSQHPAPSHVDTAYVGTSRTRLLRPLLFGRDGQVVAAGNSYNELSYGTFAEGIAAKALFPNVKRIFLEASLLLRRPPPPRYVLELDHSQYVPFLEPLFDLDPPEPEALRAFVKDALQKAAEPWWMPRIFARRDQIRLASLFGLNRQSGLSAIEMARKQLDYAGGYRQPPEISAPQSTQRPPIAATNVKVQRLQPVASWQPWDGGFELWAKWARSQGIDLVFYEPPVRSDLLAFKQGMGLPEHKADLVAVAQKYGFPYVDMNRSEAGFGTDWSLFSDEDHLDTCKGIAVLFTALDQVYSKWKQDGTLLHQPRLQDIEKSLPPMPAQCVAPQ